MKVPNPAHRLMIAVAVQGGARPSEVMRLTTAGSCMALPLSPCHSSAAERCLTAGAFRPDGPKGGA